MPPLLGLGLMGVLEQFLLMGWRAVGEVSLHFFRTRIDAGKRGFRLFWPWKSAKPVSNPRPVPLFPTSDYVFALCLETGL